MESVRAHALKLEGGALAVWVCMTDEIELRIRLRSFGVLRTRSDGMKKERASKGTVVLEAQTLKEARI